MPPYQIFNGGRHFGLAANVIGHSPINKKNRKNGRALFYFSLIFFRNN